MKSLLISFVAIALLSQSGALSAQQGVGGAGQALPASLLQCTDVAAALTAVTNQDSRLRDWANLARYRAVAGLGIGWTLARQVGGWRALRWGVAGLTGVVGLAYLAGAPDRRASRDRQAMTVGDLGSDPPYPQESQLIQALTDARRLHPGGRSVPGVPERSQDAALAGRYVVLPDPLGRAERRRRGGSRRAVRRSADAAGERQPARARRSSATGPTSSSWWSRSTSGLRC